MSSYLWQGFGSCRSHLIDRLNRGILHLWGLGRTGGLSARGWVSGSFPPFKFVVQGKRCKSCELHFYTLDFVAMARIQEDVPDLVVGVDFGMTYTGKDYVLSNICGD